VVFPILIARLVSYDLFFVPSIARHVSVEMIGLSYSVASAVNPLMTMVYGRLLDTRGRMHGLLVSTVLASGSLLLAGRLELVGPNTFLVAGISIVGIALASNWIMMTLRIVVSDICGDDVARSWGWVLSALSLIRPVAAFLTGFLAAVDYGLVLLLAGVLYLGCSSIYALLLFRGRSAQRSAPAAASLSKLVSEFRQLISLLRNKSSTW
jgi:MFS family permease